MFSQNVKFVFSPLLPNVEVVDSFTAKVSIPYTDKMVTLQIDPNVMHYEDKPEQQSPDIQVRQTMVSQGTKDTQTLTFDFQENNIKKIHIDNKNYSIKLMSIDKQKVEGMDGQEFPVFEFFVEQE